MINSGFATAEFLKFSAPVMSPFAAQGLAGDHQGKRRFPYYRVKRGNDFFPDMSHFLLSPICFSGCGRFNFEQEFSRGELTGMDIAGGFLQSRDAQEQAQGFHAGREFFYYLDGRSNYRLEPGLSRQELLKNMKRDSRARVRKIFNMADDFELVKAGEDLMQGIRVFSSLYNDTAQRVNFGAQYLFTLEQWQTLFSSPLWSLFLLKYRGEIVAGAAVAEVEGGYDYTFMGYKACELDVSRALILFIYQYLQSHHSGFLDLGGGIAEGDSLARFKLGLGARLVQFNRARFVRRSALDRGLSEQAVRQALTGRWP